jgi:prepilin-type N-terminal cleavage/methylation domain-containing protein
MRRYFFIGPSSTRHRRQADTAQGRRRRGFTLVEMMIALVITLMIVFAMVEAFRWVGESTTDGRASIEMLGQIRHARARLEDDLSRCTVPLDPWRTTAGQSQGYLGLIEGWGCDNYDIDPARNRFLVRNGAGVLGYANFNFNDPNNSLAAASQSLFGDVDDVLMLTVRNDTTPFRGRYNGAIIESKLAEIIWWAELNDGTQDIDGDGVIQPREGANQAWDPGETFTIRRRVLLIRPDLNINGNLPSAFSGMAPTQFLVDNDISVRIHRDVASGSNVLAANSLSDLNYRHNRTAHAAIDYSVVNGNGTPRGLSTAGLLGEFLPAQLPAYTAPDLIGEDVVLTNVLGFDFRVFDPHVSVTNFDPADAVDPAQEAIVPGDPAYGAALAANPRPTGTGVRVVGRGAYIDLGALSTSPALLALAYPSTNGVDDDNNGLTEASTPRDSAELAARPMFAGNMHPSSFLLAAGVPVDRNFVFDPWTANYENDGFDQDGDGAIDEGTNGIDDDSNGGADDIAGERETSPPYPHSLSSIQVRIRMYEPDTRQVRQASQIVKFRSE